MSGLRAALAHELMTHAWAHNADAHDVLRFGEEPSRSARARVKAQVLHRLGRRGFVRPVDPMQSRNRLIEILDALEVHERGWSLYEDQRSRDLYARLLALRVFGPKQVRTPRNDAAYWATEARALGLAVEGSKPRVDGLGLFDLRPAGFDLTLRCHPLNVIDVYLLRQYELARGDAVVAVAPGDVVIDGGAAWGDTALDFATSAGPTGRVLAVEFNPANLVTLRENLERNADPATIVEVVEAALWNRTGEVLSFDDAGPGTHVGGSGAHETPTVTIDDLVAERALPRVDLVKLDVEGAEREVLEGAVGTLKRFRPKLALSAYHRPNDLAELAILLSELELGYRFFLDHFTIHEEETVLYAVP